MTRREPGGLAAAAALHRIRLVHTAAWAVFAGAIVALPVAAWLGAWRATVALASIVAMECAVLVINRMRCPLTDIAARYTEDRADNFDIYLPLWLARYNKHIFGTLYAAGLVTAVALWLRRGAG